MVAADVQLKNTLELLEKEHSRKREVFESLTQRKGFIKADKIILLMELLSEHGLREELLRIGSASKDAPDVILKRMHDWAQSQQHVDMILHPSLLESRNMYLLRMLSLTTVD